MIILMITFYINKDIVIYYIILYYGTYSLSLHIYIYNNYSIHFSILYKMHHWL